MGGCLGAIMKLGPWASKENCASVNGVLERFFTHLFVNSLVLSVLVWLGDYCLVVIPCFYLTLPLSGHFWHVLEARFLYFSAITGQILTSASSELSGVLIL